MFGKGREKEEEKGREKGREKGMEKGLPLELPLGLPLDLPLGNPLVLASGLPRTGQDIGQRTADRGGIFDAGSPNKNI